jgi:hypothetical protein
MPVSTFRDVTSVIAESFSEYLVFLASRKGAASVMTVARPKFRPSSAETAGPLSQADERALTARAVSFWCRDKRRIAVIVAA